MRMRAVIVAICLALVCAEAQAAETQLNSTDRNWAFIEKYCDECHNAVEWKGNLAFDTLHPTSVAADADVWEKAIRKLRGRMMPPPGKLQPSTSQLQSFVRSMEDNLDRVAREQPNPGSVQLHRLNGVEYANAIREILGLHIDPSAFLPRDDKAGGFDNVAEALKVSPTFLDQYLSAARQLSVQAVGNRAARVQSVVYPGPPEASQYLHIDGLPLGTRGGMLIEHDFPADGEYEINIDGLVGAVFVWGVIDRNTLIVTLDDAKVFENSLGGDADLNAVDLQQAPAVAEINGRFRNIRRHVQAGPHRIGVTFLAKTAAESNEILHGFVPVTGMSVPVLGNSVGPKIATVEIRGPLRVTGLSETPSRKKIFICRPRDAAEELPCAQKILANIARQAFRRPLAADDVNGAMRFYAAGHKEAGFESGIQQGIMAILSSPKFLYRAHAPLPSTQGKPISIGDRELASRLSFFLWSGPPDAELIELAAQNKLSSPKELERQTRRLLANPRAHSLVKSFAFQWLNVHGLQLVEPDPTLFPQFTGDLVGAFETELAMFIDSIFAADRSVVDLLTANHTFVNERLALHYGIKDVRGGQFRKIDLQPSYRRGLLGKGAFLMSTSYANRTTPVLRGAYILEKFLGTPPSAPPPDVEAFPETPEGAVPLTVRARLESHRRQKSCNACHGAIDPLGLALENFNAVGQWQDKDADAGTRIDATGQLVDGTALRGPDDLRRALVDRSDQFVQTFTENLLTFALGRSLRNYDMPTVRAIVRNAAQDDYRFSTIVLGIVQSEAFRMSQSSSIVAAEASRVHR